MKTENKTSNKLGKKISNLTNILQKMIVIGGLVSTSYFAGYGMAITQEIEANLDNRSSNEVDYLHQQFNRLMDKHHNYLKYMVISLGITAIPFIYGAMQMRKYRLEDIHL